MKYIKAVIKFYLVRLFNTFMMDVVGRTHNKSGKYLLLNNDKNAEDIGWKTKSKALKKK